MKLRALTLCLLAALATPDAYAQAHADCPTDSLTIADITPALAHSYVAQGKYLILQPGRMRLSPEQQTCMQEAAAQVNMVYCWVPGLPANPQVWKRLDAYNAVIREAISEKQPDNWVVLYNKANYECSQRLKAAADSTDAPPASSR